MFTIPTRRCARAIVGPVRTRPGAAWQVAARVGRCIEAFAKSKRRASATLPREEHSLLLHVAAGAAGDDVGICALDDHVMGSVQSPFVFGQNAHLRCRR